jgi:hypothetical protein
MKLTGRLKRPSDGGLIELGRPGNFEEKKQNH